MKNKELFQIGEVSRLFHISIGILRYYDKIGLVRPEYTDPDTGYRYYSPRQFESLNTIRYLRVLDMPLDEISSFLQNRNVDKIQELLLKQQEEVKRRQHDLQLIEHKINNRLNQIRDALSSNPDVITITHTPARRIASIKQEIVPKSYLDLEYSIRQLEEAAESSVTFLGKVGVGISKQHLLEGHFQAYDIVFIILDEEDEYAGNISLLPEETCVSIRFCGGHSQSSDYYSLSLIHI